ncbi:MAG TPA: hypothetical protein VM123_00760 [archaeon]|nr:hypothetical protein [archaeon]
MYNAQAGLCAGFLRKGELGEVEQKSQVPGLTFVSFCLKRNGFASFAFKRRIKIYLYG